MSIEVIRLCVSLPRNAANFSFKVSPSHVRRSTRRGTHKNRKTNKTIKGTFNALCFKIGLIFLKRYLDHYAKKTGFDMLWHDCFSIHFSHMTSQLGVKTRTHPWNRYLRLKKNNTLTKSLRKMGISQVNGVCTVWYFPLQ